MPRRGEGAGGALESIRKHPAATEILHHSHKHPENLAFVFAENEPPVNHPRNTVIYGRLLLRFRPRRDPTFLPFLTRHAPHSAE